MLDEFLWKLFPPGGDVVTGVTQVILWLGALVSLGSALLCGLVRAIVRLQPRPVPMPVPVPVPARRTPQLPPPSAR